MGSKPLLGRSRRNPRVKVWSREAWTTNRELRLKDNLHVAAALRELRTVNGVTQAQVAERMGLSGATLCSKEGGVSSFSTEQIARFRRAIARLRR